MTACGERGSLGRVKRAETISPALDGGGCGSQDKRARHCWAACVRVESQGTSLGRSAAPVDRHLFFRCVRRAEKNSGWRRAPVPGLERK